MISYLRVFPLVNQSKDDNHHFIFRDGLIMIDINV
ncbi:hypothetical protein Dd586_1408 [Dickeya parazeae Ech586]|uniref:Uncharacterized protein n=1 Tax=Dickeya zeae (strain Ech586) TaxID=590409 RepID=D2BWB3_DICZ5|nr:hypothetical protein Dd586_1408 [Dickeya parazeae Ech586]